MRVWKQQQQQQRAPVTVCLGAVVCRSISEPGAQRSAATDHARGATGDAVSGRGCDVAGNGWYCDRAVGFITGPGTANTSALRTS
jgi:hypothetical protein